MYYFDGFIYGWEPEETIRVLSVKPLPDKILLLTFNNHEQRVFDASILDGPAFGPLMRTEIFENPKIDHEVVTWADGQIDCAPEYMYKHSYEYAMSKDS